MELDHTKETPEELPVGDIEDSSLFAGDHHDALPAQPEATADSKVPDEPSILGGPELPPESELQMNPNVSHEVPVQLEDPVQPNVTVRPDISRRIEIPIEPAAAFETELSTEPEPSDDPDPSDYEEQFSFESATEEPEEPFTEPTEETSEGEEETDFTTAATPAASEETSVPGSTGETDKQLGDLGLGSTEAEKEEITPPDGLDLDDTEVNLDGEYCQGLNSPASYCLSLTCSLFGLFYTDVEVCLLFLSSWC